MKNLSRKLAKFYALSWRDQQTFVAAIMQLTLLAIGLRMGGFRRYLAKLQHPLQGIAPKPNPDEAGRLAALISHAAQLTPTPTTCLTRSLLLCRLLRGQGIDAQLQIGVRLASGTFEAHAWVEVAGHPVNDRPDVSEKFAAFSGNLPAGAFQSP